jgi:hypothetical protein
MATYWNGQGGKVSAGAGPTDLDVITWSLKKGSRLAETTNANSGGAASYIAGVKEYSGTFDVMWDSTALPETVIGEGMQVTLKLYMGGSTKFYQISAVIESLEPKVDARQGAVMYTCSWKGTGTITNTA